MIETRCGDSVECGNACGNAVVCVLTVTGREYARLKAIADTLNALAGETPNCGCEADNTPATVFAGFFASWAADSLSEDPFAFVANDVADAGWDDAEECEIVAARLSEALKIADVAFAKSA